MASGIGFYWFAYSLDMHNQQDSYSRNRSDQNAVTTLGMAYHRYGNKPFGVLQADRGFHFYVIGQTGTGKSTLLLNMALQDAKAGRGFCLIDPHGDLANELTDTIGPNYKCNPNRLGGHTFTRNTNAQQQNSAKSTKPIIWNVADPNSPFGYNPLTRTSKALRPLVASGLIEALRKQWSDAWGVRMEHLLRYAILALLELPQTDVRDILRIYLDSDFRRGVIANISDPQVKQFWTKELPAMNYKNAADGLAPIANKLGAFLAHPVIRNAICEPKQPLRFRQIMDEGRVFIINLSKGQLGTDLANVLGGLIVSSIMHAAFTRHDTPEHDRKPFALYVDEFHSITTEAMADLLSETRKYGLSLILSHQHSQQATPDVLASIYGNIGNIFCFRVGAQDAPALSMQLGNVEPRDLISLPNHHAFVRLMIDGQQTKAFSAETLPNKR